jgi:ABC-type Fe3+/spermidine/putrescine transport system ATPase subunit
MPNLVLRDLQCRYGDVNVVDNINLTLNDHEFVSLLGPSGCGKTTTLRMIAGFIEPTGGSIESDGVLLSRPGAVTPPEGRGIAMIFQSYAVWPHMTVEQNVAFGLELRKLPTADVEKKVKDILTVVRLAHLAGRYPSELSGGQQQRVALARAMVVEPKILLLDEPLSNLDVHLRDELRQEIRRLHDRFGTTTVYVTHDQSEALATSDRIVVLNGGRIEQTDAPYNLYMHPKTRFVAEFIGKTNIIEGRREGSQIMCPGFAMPLFPHSGDVIAYSVRPQSLRRASGAKTPEDSVGLETIVTKRTFFGDHWEYDLEGPEALQLKACFEPTEIIEPGQTLSIEILRSAISPVQQ